MPAVVSVVIGIRARYLGLVELGALMLVFPWVVQWGIRSVRVVVHEDRLEVWAPAFDRRDPETGARCDEPVAIVLDQLRCRRVVPPTGRLERLSGSIVDAWDLRDGSDHFVRIKPTFIRRSDRKLLDALIRERAVVDSGPEAEPSLPSLVR